MTSKREYSLGQAALLFTAIPVVMFGLGVAMLPLGLLNAWIAYKLWNWFAVPYFHAPHIGVWLMLVTIWFFGLWRSSQASVKKEYRDGYGMYFASEWTSKFLTLLFAWFVHLYVLRG